MGKLRLKMDDLRVESFDVREDVPAERGTVRAQGSRYEGSCEGTDYDHCPPSYAVPCYWTGDPQQDCNPASVLNPCTDYPGYC